MREFTASLTIRLKAGVLDPEAKTTKQALERLGFDLQALRSADMFEIDLEAESSDAARERVDAMAERLLANPTIHDYEISIEER